MLSLKTQGNTNTSGSFHGYFKDLFAKKRDLVKLELDAIVQVQTDWENILGSTVTDRAMAETSIKDCYRYAGLNPPSIIWADHPLSVIKIAINRPDLCNVSGAIVNQIWQSELTIQKSISPTSAAYVLKHINPKHTISTPKGNQQIPPITDRLNELVMNRVNALCCDLTNRTLPIPLQDYHIGDLGYFDYFLRIGVNIPHMQPAIDLAKSCGWCWAFDGLAILTPKPSKVTLDRHAQIIGIIYNDLNILS
jgi:hypothetical protein